MRKIKAARAELREYKPEPDWLVYMDAYKALSYWRMRAKNSSRVFWSVRKQPSITDVIVLAWGFSTPRITMHRWLGGGWEVRVIDMGRLRKAGGGHCHGYLACMTTATPRGSMVSIKAHATCFVSRSCDPVDPEGG